MIKEEDLKIEEADEDAEEVKEESKGWFKSVLDFVLPDAVKNALAPAGQSHDQAIQARI